MSWPWSELGLPGPADLTAVKHAYAQRLKTTHPEEDPEGFQRLHTAFQTASRIARQERRRSGGAPPPPSPPPVREERTGREREGWDYDQLLREGESARREEKEEETPPEWDYDRLLREGESAHQEEKEEETPPEWDYDQLLHEERPAPREKEGRQDWDYERLFAEGDKERAQARSRRGRERRSAYEQTRRRQFEQEQARWRSTETLLHTLELLYTSGAPETEWNKLLQGGAFQQAKGSLDLIFGLEDFVSGHRDLPQGARLELFRAFGFDRGVSRPELRPLYQMLFPAWQAEKRRKHRSWAVNVLTVLAVMAVVLMSGVVLTSAMLPIYLLLGWLAFHGLRKGWFKREPKNLRRGGRSRRWIPAALAAALAVALILAAPELVKRLNLAHEGPREQVCRYLAEDFGGEFASLYVEGSENAQRYSNVFREGQASSHLFLAGPDGERDVEADRRGYTTNYPDMKLLWSLRQFVQNQSASVTLSMEGKEGLESWETTGRYILRIPYSGADEVIRQLGAWLETAAQADWYQRQPPVFHLTLASYGVKAGESMVIFDYSSDSGPFDTRAVLAYYVEEFPFLYCAQLIRACEMDQGGRGSGLAVENMAAQGRMELDGESFYWLAGLDGENNVVIQYFVSPGGSRIRAIPDAVVHTEEEILDLPFYKLVHLPQDGSVRFRFVDVYYPWYSQHT